MKLIERVKCIKGLEFNFFSARCNGCKSENIPECEYLKDVCLPMYYQSFIRKENEE